MISFYIVLKVSLECVFEFIAEFRGRTAVVRMIHILAMLTFNHWSLYSMYSQSDKQGSLSVVGPVNDVKKIFVARFSGIYFDWVMIFVAKPHLNMLYSVFVMFAHQFHFYRRLVLRHRRQLLKSNVETPISVWIDRS